jgi:A/G-specific adenine glycosylase
MCHGFFQRFPTSEQLLRGWIEGDLDPIIRMGQKPFIESAARVIREHGGVIPQDKDGLQQIKGVGEKIAECVIAYGWGGEALPLDGNGCRMVERVIGLAAGVPVGCLRVSLKDLYRSYRPWMEERGLAMVDLHEMIRLHAQTICTKAPRCSLCPVSTCLSRQAEYQNDSFPAVDPESWRDWRELLLEPVQVG